MGAQPLVKTHRRIVLFYVDAHLAPEALGFGQNFSHDIQPQTLVTMFAKQRDVDDVQSVGAGVDIKATAGNARLEDDKVFAVWVVSLIMGVLRLELHPHKGQVLDLSPSGLSRLLFSYAAVDAQQQPASLWAES